MSARDHIDAQLTPHEYNFNIRPYISNKKLNEQYPPGTLIIISNPPGEPEYSHVNPQEQLWSIRFPDLIYDETNKNLWTDDDIAYIYDFPIELIPPMTRGKN